MATPPSHLDHFYISSHLTFSFSRPSWVIFLFLPCELPFFLFKVSLFILSVISDLSTVDLYMFYLDLERIFLNLYFLSPVFPFKAIVATFIITVF